MFISSEGSYVSLPYGLQGDVIFSEAVKKYVIVLDEKLGRGFEDNTKLFVSSKIKLIKISI
jgi:hypothetical protein